MAKGKDRLAPTGYYVEVDAQPTATWYNNQGHVNKGTAPYGVQYINKELGKCKYSHWLNGDMSADWETLSWVAALTEKSWDNGNNKEYEYFKTYQDLLNSGYTFYPHVYKNKPDIDI